jgi:NADH-quinone oxidoreductase subunit M
VTSYPLTPLIALPLLGLVTLFLLPARWARFAQPFAALVSLAAFLFTLRLSPNITERHLWIPSIGAQYLLVLDGISFLLVALTGLLCLLAILSSHIESKSFYATLLLIQAACCGVFLAQDLLLFFLCFESVLIPMYFLISLWGSEDRGPAAYKFVVYTAVGSIALLLGFLALYFQHATQSGVYTFELQALLSTKLDPALERLIFWAIFLGFAIKVPMVPFHTWLPDAHTQAPTAGSVILAAVMLKMGSYGFLRFALPLLPGAAMDVQIVRLLGVLSLAAILYGGLVSIAQSDWKRLIAYSSVSHMGFVTLGIFSGNATALSGSILQQVNHGISTGLLFLLAGMVYERRHTRNLNDFGGLAHRMPWFATVFGFAVFSSAGLPLLNGFVGEFTILRGVAVDHPLWSVGGVLGMIVAAAYLLVLYMKTMMGPARDANHGMADMSPREWLTVLPLIAWAFWIGVAPGAYFRLIDSPVQLIMERLRP